MFVTFALGYPSTLAQYFNKSEELIRNFSKIIY